MTETTALKACPKCGARAELIKAGSRRFWVRCTQYAGNGNCNAIGAQADNKKEALLNWNNKR